MSDKKGNKYSTVHADRTKKRTFRGNQYTAKQSTDFTSTSAKKLLDTKELDVTISSHFAYCILEFATVFSTISSAVICKKCKGEVNFESSNFRGASFKIFMSCKCDSPLVINSCPMIKNAAEINCRIIFAMRLLGIGREGLNIFCGLMDMRQGISKSAYYACLENIHIASSAVYKIVLSQAIAQEKDFNKEAGKPEDEFTSFWRRHMEKAWIFIFVWCLYIDWKIFEQSCRCVCNE